MSDFSLLTHTEGTIPDASEMRFGIIVTEWNNDITDKLLESAINTLVAHGAAQSSITIKRVPGSFELVFGAQQMAKYGHVNAIIAIGCVIKGDTPHFDYISESTTLGLATLNTTENIPVINGVLTVNNHQQALDRAGGCVGDKGAEFAVTAIKMVDFAWEYQK